MVFSHHWISKNVSPEYSEEFRESFTSEAKAMAKLNHSNLLGVFDPGQPAEG